MSDLSLLGISGSLRAASTNRLLIRAAARHFDPASFIEAEIDFPIYNGDLEDKGIPDAVTLLGRQIDEADAVIISTPEYNKGLSGGLKNALDWVSRLEGNPWRDKPVAIMSAASGVAGGARGQSMLRTLLNPFRPHVIPGPEVMVGQTSKQWNEDGTLANEGTHKFLGELMSELRKVAEARSA
ncbi:NADPH-dependent FMN reductase [Litorisediminicola beolgyonensis]|uniref:NADPH-dependent FMN reductase n=1 Tax=Litorisediminicola beolgyonensis TaxID=1173614 RepID=A0ABW3ZI02_9RHOB